MINKLSQILHLIHFCEFPETMHQVVDKLSALLGPYQVSARHHFAHLTLRSVARRRHKGTILGSALRQPHVRILRIEHILSTLVILHMQRTERAVQLLRRDAQLLRHLGGGEARNGIQHIIRIHRLRQKSVHLTLQSHHILSLDSHADHLVVHLLVESMNLLILFADKLLVKSHLHFLIMQQLLLLLQQRLLFLQGSTENLFGIANHLLLALPPHSPGYNRPSCESEAAPPR